MLITSDVVLRFTKENTTLKPAQVGELCLGKAAGWDTVRTNAISAGVCKDLTISLLDKQERDVANALHEN